MIKYIILLLLITSCSSSKIEEKETKVEKERIHFKSPLLKYIHKKNASKRTQLAYI